MASPHARRALGRGLTNLIPIDTEDRGSGNEVVFVDINAIASNPFQPRQTFNQDEIKNLAQSIEKQGLLQPILLRKKEKGYEIISGERRFRAMKQLGHDKVPCVIKPKITDAEMVEMALVENIQREDLNDIEQAMAYHRLMIDCGLSHEEISIKIGKSRSTITNFLRLLKLPEKIQEMVKRKELTMGHARALLGIDDPQQQIALADKIAAENLTVRDIEKATQLKKEKKPEPPKTAHKREDQKHIDPDLMQQTEKLRYQFGTMVNILQSSGEKGKIEIHFYSTNDLNRLIELLLLCKT
ncbi:MAG: ParB/RepB/Spo0J family partition protein [Chitinivibrionales bacterium]